MTKKEHWSRWPLSLTEHDLILILIEAGWGWRTKRYYQSHWRRGGESWVHSTFSWDHLCSSDMLWAGTGERGSGKILIFISFFLFIGRFQLESAIVHETLERASDLESEVEETEVRHRGSQCPLQWMVVFCEWGRRPFFVVRKWWLHQNSSFQVWYGVRILPPNAIETNWLFWFHIYDFGWILSNSLFVTLSINEYLTTINHIDSNIPFHCVCWSIEVSTAALTIKQM